MALFLTRTLDLLVDEGKVDAVGTIETYAVSGARAGSAFGASRTCTATVPSGTVVDLALVPDGSITTTAGGAVRFRDANGDNRADLPAVAPEISSVDGDTAKNGDMVPNVTSDGSITVVITEESAASAVTLLVWGDPASGNNQLDLVPNAPADSQPKAAAESFGFGCETVFGPPEAAAGSSTPTVGSVDRGLDLFTSTSNLTYFFDATDTFQIGGTGVPKATFEGVLSVGDVLSVNYNPSGSAPSVFNITTDDVRAATNVTATVVNADNGSTANDVRITFTPNPVNGPATVYEVQRGRVVTASCSAGGPPPVQWEKVEDSRNGTAVDENQSGCYQYRVVSKNPSPSTSQATSEPSDRVESPDTARPTFVDSRLMTDAGTVGRVDTGDVHRFIFSEPMHPKTALDGAAYRLASDPADGNEVIIPCDRDNTTCSLNSSPVTIGGTTYEAGRVMTVTVGTPWAVTEPEPRGSNVTYGARVIATSGMTDESGNQLNPTAADSDNRVDTENA